MLPRRTFLGSLPVLAAAQTSSPAPPQDLVLWYRQPADKWTDALPVGNGRLGAMIFGRLDEECIALNEDNLWSGHPREWNNPDAKNHLAELRRLVLEQEDYVAADRLALKMQGPYNQSYLPLGNLKLKFAAPAASAEYRRSLDLDTALATVDCGPANARHHREAFASAPDQVIAVRLTGPSLTFDVSLDSPLRSASETLGQATLRLTGKAPAHAEPNYNRNEPDPIRYDDVEGKGMRFECLLQVRTEGGAVRAEGSRLRVENAKAVTILLTAATGYRGFDRMPDRPASEIHAECEARLRAAAARPYAELRRRHIADHQKLFRRVALELGPATLSHLPTDERLRQFKQQPDPRLLQLYFQYGRYLLIASSRPGTQPANLQGIWNDLVRPPWSSNWTANINVQMNYWLAETCNLAECHQPLFDLTEGVSRTGRETARVNYGARGWVSHHNIDVWRQSAPVGNYGAGSPTWANWPMSGPWLCQHLWEHYQFHRDPAFLRRIYPVLKGAAEFCLDWLTPDPQGRLTTCPSVSARPSRPRTPFSPRTARPRRSAPAAPWTSRCFMSCSPTPPAPPNSSTPTRPSAPN